jgi:hypothetical protein
VRYELERLCEQRQWRHFTSTTASRYRHLGEREVALLHVVYAAA